ncbi:dual specificity protein phosphatase [Trifolium repens]|nr:dual specificity protein phosphatase [Trifolium repens]
MKPRFGAACGLLFFTCCRASDKLIPAYFIRYATMIVTLEREVEELRVKQRIVDEKRREALNSIWNQNWRDLD